MKVKGQDPKEVVLKLLKRSTCRVQVAALLKDKHGIHAWGINHAGNGFGCCAEQHCFTRANYKRIAGSVLWVAGRRAKSKNPVTALPCAACWQLAKSCAYIVYRHKDGTWITLRGEQG